MAVQGGLKKGMEQYSFIIDMLANNDWKWF